MLYVSVRWSRLHGLKWRRSMAVMGRTVDILAKVPVRVQGWTIG